MTAPRGEDPLRRSDPASGSKDGSRLSRRTNAETNLRHLAHFLRHLAHSQNVGPHPVGFGGATSRWRLLVMMTRGHLEAFPTPAVSGPTGRRQPGHCWHSTHRKSGYFLRPAEVALRAG